MDNVFESLENGFPPLPRPLAQTDGGNMRQVNNWFGFHTGSLSSCDFDRDGRTDRFMATGVTWWYESSLENHWVYLNASRCRRAA